MLRILCFSVFCLCSSVHAGPIKNFFDTNINIDSGWGPASYKRNIRSGAISEENLKTWILLGDYPEVQVENASLDFKVVDESRGVVDIYLKIYNPRLSIKLRRVEFVRKQIDNSTDLYTYRFQDYGSHRVERAKLITENCVLHAVEGTDSRWIRFIVPSRTCNMPYVLSFPGHNHQKSSLVAYRYPFTANTEMAATSQLLILREDNAPNDNVFFWSLEFAQQMTISNNRVAGPFLNIDQLPSYPVSSRLLGDTGMIPKYFSLFAQPVLFTDGKLQLYFPLEESQSFRAESVTLPPFIIPELNQSQVLDLQKSSIFNFATNSSWTYPFTDGDLAIAVLSDQKEFFVKLVVEGSDCSNNSCLSDATKKLKLKTDVFPLAGGPLSSLINIADPPNFGEHAHVLNMNLTNAFDVLVDDVTQTRQLTAVTLPSPAHPDLIVTRMQAAPGSLKFGDVMDRTIHSACNSPELSAKRNGLLRAYPYVFTFATPNEPWVNSLSCLSRGTCYASEVFFKTAADAQQAFYEAQNGSFTFSNVKDYKGLSLKYETVQVPDSTEKVRITNCEILEWGS